MLKKWIITVVPFFVLGVPLFGRLPFDTMVEVNHIESGQVAWIVEIDLKAVTQDGNTVEWSCEEIRYTQIGSPDTYWSDSDCTFDSSSGYWEVTHDDPDDPDNSEFLDTPGASGVATPDSGSGIDLRYEWSQGAGTVASTAYWDYDYADDSSPTPPIKDGVDEPVDVPRPDSSPTIGRTPTLKHAAQLE